MGSRLAQLRQDGSKKPRAAWMADVGSNPDLVTHLPYDCWRTCLGFHFLVYKSRELAQVISNPTSSEILWDYKKQSFFFF